MSCTDACEYLNKISTTLGTLKVEGACEALNKSIVLSERAMQSFQLLLELHEKSINSINRYEVMLNKVRKQKHEFKQEIEALKMIIQNLQRDRQALIVALEDSNKEGKIFDVNAFLQKRTQVVH